MARALLLLFCIIFSLSWISLAFLSFKTSLMLLLSTATIHVFFPFQLSLNSLRHSLCSYPPPPQAHVESTGWGFATELVLWRAQWPSLWWSNWKSSALTVVPLSRTLPKVTSFFSECFHPVHRMLQCPGFPLTSTGAFQYLPLLVPS